MGFSELVCEVDSGKLSAPFDALSLDISLEDCSPEGGKSELPSVASASSEFSDFKIIPPRVNIKIEEAIYSQPLS